MKHVEKLRSIRKSRKLTLREISLATGIDAGWLSLVERGKADLKVAQLFDVAKALGVEPAELLRKDER